MIYFVATLCAICLAAGQILFKISANGLQQTGSLFAQRTFIPLFSALALYGVTTIAWVWVLQYIELSRVYPLLALVFVFVPVGSYFILKERVKPQYFLGIALIIAGVIVIVQ